MNNHNNTIYWSMQMNQQINVTSERPLAWQETNPAEVGMSAAGVQKIADVFERQFANGHHPAAQLVVARQGRVVLDRTIGVLRQGGRESVRPSTLFQTFSCTKTLMALCTHKLIEEGKIELDAPVAVYWPEFGQKGKEKATIRHTLLHQAGIPQKGLYRQIPHWWNWKRVTQHVARTPAEYEPGTKTAYHLVNFGFILGEVLRRVTNIDVQEYFDRHLFTPLGMENAYLGLPHSEADRAAEVYWGAADQRNAVLLFRRARYTVVPAATLNCAARDLAVFYQMVVNGGVYNGHRVIQPKTVEQMLTIGSEGIDGTLGSFIRWGHGVILGGKKPAGVPNENQFSYGKASTPHTFGHPGQRSCLAWGDREAQLLVIFLCNRLIGDGANAMRWQSLSDAVWAAVAE